MAGRSTGPAELMAGRSTSPAELMAGRSSGVEQKQWLNN
jgi:hypothetical protein